MASDLLGLGSQSVLTAQRQLNTTSHNISNVNTEGFSRQSVIQGTNMPRMFGGSTYGMGVHVDNVRRSWDQFAVDELNLATTNHASRTDVDQDLDMLSNMLSSIASKKIPDNLHDWFDAVNVLSDTPNDIGAREVVLEKAGIITDTLNSFQDSVRQQYDVVNKRLDVGIKRINQLAIEIRDVQRLMMSSPGPHNDLRDEHEKLVKELAQYTKVTVTTRQNAEGFNIHIGNGHTIVSGTEASQLQMIEGYPDVHQRRLAIVEGPAVKPIKSDSIDGKLGAMLRFRDQEIPNVLDELGRMSTAFAYQINQLQHQGLDLNGDVGSDLFMDVNSELVAASRVIKNRDSQADMAVYIDDLSNLKGGEYSLRYDGSDYEIYTPNGEKKTLSPLSGPNGDQFYLDGMRVEIRTPPQEGEKILLRPTREGAAQIELATTDPKKVAAQSFEASTTFANGKADFKIDQAGDLKEFSVVISPSGNQFAVLDKSGKVIQKPDDYPPSGPVSVSLPSDHPDFDDGTATVFELSAGALARDKFTANLVPSPGDNGNLRKMFDVQSAQTLDDEESTLVDVYNNLNTNVGLRSSTASRLSDISKQEKEQAESRVASISGVNLDEEAANMMRFQQAYMASSRIMQAANDTFNTILQLR